MKNRSTSNFYVHGRLVQPQLNRIASISVERTSGSAGRSASAGGSVLPGWYGTGGSNVGGDDVYVQLEPKIMQVLICLAERPGDVVSKEELMESAWPDVVVTDDVLARAISELRKVFGDDPRDPSVIETIRKRGYRLIAEVDEPDAIAVTDAETGPSLSPSAFLWYAVAAVVALILFLLIAEPFKAAGTAASPLKPVPVTSLPGQEVTPALSPDGRYVAMSWNGAGEDNWDIYVQRVGVHSQRRLTDDPAADGSPAWSPDGRHVAFVRRTEDACGIFVIPISGGPERQVGPCRETNYADLAWSADGRWLAFNDVAGTDRAHSIMLMSVESGESRRLTYPPETMWGDFDPAFSPDSRLVAFARARSEGLQDLYVVAIDGNAETRLLSEGRNLYGITWSSDGADVIYSSNVDGTYDLWRVPVSGGPARPVMSGQQHLVNPSIRSRDGRLAYESRSYDVDIRRLDVARGSDAGPVLSSTRWEMYPAFSPDGDRLAFVSNRSGSYELWVSNADGTEPVRLTYFDGTFVSTPRWSPRGDFIAFDARPNGHADIFVIDAAGGRPDRLVTHGADDVAPFWSNDGRWLYFGSDRAGTWEIWRTPSPVVRATPGGDVVRDTPGGEAERITPDGEAARITPRGEAVRVTPNGGFSGRVSEDDSSLFVARHGKAGLWKMPARGGAASPVLDDLDPGDWGNWDILGDDVYFVHRGDSVEIRRRSLSSGAEEHVFTLPRVTPTHDIGVAVSPDAKFILYPAISRRDADIMMVEGLE